MYDRSKSEPLEIADAFGRLARRLALHSSRGDHASVASILRRVDIEAVRRDCDAILSAVAASRARDRRGVAAALEPYQPPRDLRPLEEILLVETDLGEAEHDRVLRLLEDEGISTVGMLCKTSAARLLAIDGFSAVSLAAVDRVKACYRRDGEHLKSLTERKNAGAKRTGGAQATCHNPSHRPSTKKILRFV